MLEYVHHVNLLVRDLAQAMAAWRRLGIEHFIEERLPGRGVDTARFRVGTTWIVLVMPTDPQGVPALHLARHGEGLFLLSFGVSSLPEACSFGPALSVSRPGLDGWRVADLDPGEFQGALLQLCQDPDRGHPLPSCNSDAPERP